MILDAGYPAEIHPVTTEDCYILELHRYRAIKETKCQVVCLNWNLEHFVWDMHWNFLFLTILINV